MNHPAARHGARHRFGVLLHRWHRRGGLFAALFLIWLACSGLLLNESHSLHLDQLRLDWPWLMRAYGLQTLDTEAFVAGEHWLLEDEGRSLLDGQALALPIHGVIGMVESQGLLYVATGNSLVLLSPQGQRIDELHAPPLPATPIERLGLQAQQLVIRAGALNYRSSDGERWQATDGEAVQWSQRAPLSPERLQQAGLRPSLPLSRVLADLHSGQIFGSWGRRFVDLIGLAAILLALTGVWAALRRRHHRRH